MSNNKRPTDHLIPSAKKRAGERQISREEPSDSDEEVCTADLSQIFTLVHLRPFIPLAKNINPSTIIRRATAKWTAQGAFISWLADPSHLVQIVAGEFRRARLCRSLLGNLDAQIREL